MSCKPKVSIASPVYNGERYLAKALDSVLAQTFGDFELIVTDNASTDATEQICREYAARDPRVRYVRNDHNVGVVANFNLGIELSRGEYFRWHCYDDLMAPRCLEACLGEMEADKTLAVTQCATELIDENGCHVEMFDREWQLDAPEAHVRFWSMLWTRCFPPIFGLMRSDLVRKTHMFRPYVGADRYFLAELLLLGGLKYVPECLFSIRVHPQAYRVRGNNPEVRRHWYTPGARRLPAFMQMPMTAWAFLTTAIYAPVNWADKLRCLGHVGGWTLEQMLGIARRRI